MLARRIQNVSVLGLARALFSIVAACAWLILAASSASAAPPEAGGHVVRTTLGGSVPVVVAHDEDTPFRELAAVIESSEEGSREHGVEATPFALSFAHAAVAHGVARRSSYEIDHRAPLSVVLAPRPPPTA